MSHDNLGFTSSTDALDNKKWSAKANQNGYDPSQNKNKVYVLELEDKKKSVQEYEEDYDPYNHRVVQHPTTSLETLLHLLKGSLGTGILAMPKAFHNSGYGIGIVATIIIGLFCTYCIRILVSSEYELCKRKRVPSLTYPATAEAALSVGPRPLRPLAKASVHIINLFLMVYQLGSCCVYTVFVATNLKLALKSTLPDIDVRLYMLAILLPLILVNWIRNLKFLAPCSTIANCITFVSFGIILYYIFREPLSFENREVIGNVENFPLYFGTVLFALEAIGVIMPLENEMKHPRTFIRPVGVLNTGMGLIVVLYTCLGFFGYIRYGSAIEGSITFSLEEPEYLAKTVQVLLAIAIFFTHPIQCYVAIDIAWNEYIAPNLEKNSHKLLWEYVVRTSLVLLTFLLAVAIPQLDLFISLFGALCLSGLGLAFPAIIQICTFWNVCGRTEKTLMLAKNMSLILFGLLGLIVGTYTSLRDIIKTFS
ncbi:PREDICTED: proton-coupled amino acid transporter-like protein CG1139 isoform X1 [Habropoda laboriosa]|uniref:proton-coupled amino acid transporter-like protein CG1139 isoform X1 n=1 Tax=Habropoda laboriosa TaxID=597456 RepID=UPI00083E3544|nr:PREDICTED: proton-coupled amino acid transporter-like protein CG1139 isoform X1 [Habropoda laboriosa]